MSVDDWDPLVERSDPHHYWTTTNIGEGIPGVQTPLSWTTWQPVGQSLRDTGFAVGAFTRAELRGTETVMSIFYGRSAFRLDGFVKLGDRLPGTSGEAVVESLLGRVPPDIETAPTLRRLPVVAWRFPYTFLTIPRRLRQTAARMDRWYVERLAAVPAMSLDEARASFAEARRLLLETVSLQTITGLAIVQPLYDPLDGLVRRTGIGDTGLFSGGGGAEVAGLVSDIWTVSRGELALEEVQRRHGFHGPLEGELSSRVWREDPAPLERLVEDYAAMPDSEDPAVRLAARKREAVDVARQLLAAVPVWQRPAIRALLSLARKRIPLRGVAKRSHLQAFDVGRASARRAGELLAAERVLGEPDDVFYLTVAELTGALPADARELVAKRRERRDSYLGLSVPSDWKGNPVPEPLDADLAEATIVEGVGVSAGVAEGVVRVVLDPADAPVEPGEVLVAPTTDPGWASVMFISSALVVDIGGAISHAAIVARELGLPCVVNTRTGTRQLRTGDRVRVDGGRGSVEILERASAPTQEETLPC